MSSIYTVGETTFDIVFRDGQPTGAFVGGSVLNTSLTLGRLGLPVSFISRMGKDKIGDLSLRFLKENGINCEYISRFDGNSRLALAFLDQDNNASYQFYKAEKAPALFFPEPRVNDIITFGSTNALRDEGRNSLLLFLNQAHDKNALTVYDPNIREFGPLEIIEIRRKFEENIYLSKVLKGSTTDFERLYDTSDVDELFKKFRDFGVEILIITSAEMPVSICTKNISLSIPVEPLQTVSTIGAGDNFTAGLIYGFYHYGIRTTDLNQLSENTWRKIIGFALTLSSEVCRSESNYISKAFARQFEKMIAL
ncbi:PfkB family carbohydrate kinase [Roseimarinus sediminis]|uniref:PfkB family carbohydrate kinase n=1 Tax=Roseimarinus sediminis TaxID=1610899 RepID=UPI003D2372B3